MPSKARVVRATAIVVGAVLTVIGLRFWLAPDSAARDFGIGRGAYSSAFHDVIALRDMWLGLLAIVLACVHEWRALALWFGLGTLVCFVDAGIATASDARWFSIAFHILSGFLMAGLARLALQLSAARRTR